MTALLQPKSAPPVPEPDTAGRSDAIEKWLAKAAQHRAAILLRSGGPLPDSTPVIREYRDRED